MDTGHATTVWGTSRRMPSSRSTSDRNVLAYHVHNEQSRTSSWRLHGADSRQERKVALHSCADLLNSEEPGKFGWCSDGLTGAEVQVRSPGAAGGVS